MTRDEILEALRRQDAEGVTYWDAFDTAAFFRRFGPSWSPAETVRHLTKSTFPVAKALGISKLFLLLRFGKPRRTSVTYDDLQTRYLGLLAEGGQAGRFAPSPKSEDDPEAWRAEIMRSFARANSDLRTAVSRWRDPQLDRYQLPHPLLGKLTIREMLYFMLYHQRHHLAVVERHRAEQKVR